VGDRLLADMLSISDFGPFKLLNETSLDEALPDETLRIRLFGNKRSQTTPDTVLVNNASITQSTVVLLDVICQCDDAVILDGESPRRKPDGMTPAVLEYLTLKDAI
jgi:hypothetical protein